MKKFEIISHPADIKLRIEGSSSAELFAAALGGMAEIVKRDSCQESGSLPVTQDIKIKSLDQTALLVDFLSEVLAQAHEKKAVFCRVEFLKFDNNDISAKISGRRVNQFDEDIKAVTYHGAQIVKNSAGNLETEILFDI